MYELPFKTQTAFRRFATKVDCSHNAVWNLSGLKKWIDFTSQMGYNALMLYCEDTYEVDGHPYFGYGRGRFSAEELKELDAYALEHGVELIASINVLELPTIFRWPQYTAINDTYGILLCDDERTYALIDSMLSACARCFTSRVIDLNMDVAEMLGRGKHQSTHGYEKSEDIFKRHAETMRRLAQKHGFETVLISGQAGTCTDTERWAVGDVWVGNGFNPENCYSIESLRRCIEVARTDGVENLTVRLLGHDGGECSRFAGLPAVFCAGAFAKGITDQKAIKRDFEQTLGIGFDDFMLLDLTQRGEVEECGVHPSRYILYNDPFMGLMDKTIPDCARADHAELVRLLTPLCGHSEWGYLFRTLRDLCAVTAEKCDIGIRIHAAYEAGDKEKLGELAGELRHIRDLVEVFYKSFRRQWMLENKGHGFDVSDVRIGGVMTRLVHCARRLEEYVAGKVDHLAELEDEQQDVRTPLNPEYGVRKYLTCRDEGSRLYCDIVSTNVLFKHRR